MAATQRAYRRRIVVGSGLTEVSSVRDWYDGNHFANEDEARGAFKLAHQQAVDGMGATHAAWMGLTDDEFDAWMRSGALPKKRRV